MNFFSETFKKLSEVCNLDKKTGSFFINEAFTFEPISSFDLKKLNIDIQVINYQTKEPIGQVRHVKNLKKSFYFL